MTFFTEEGTKQRKKLFSGCGIQGYSEVQWTQSTTALMTSRSEHKGWTKWYPGILSNLNNPMIPQFWGIYISNWKVAGSRLLSIRGGYKLHALEERLQKTPVIAWNIEKEWTISKQTHDMDSQVLQDCPGVPASPLSWATSNGCVRGLLAPVISGT